MGINLLWKLVLMGFSKKKLKRISVGPKPFTEKFNSLWKLGGPTLTLALSSEPSTFNRPFSTRTCSFT